MFYFYLNIKYYFHPANIPARLAQSVEHETLNLRVVGSSPTLGENFCHFVMTSWELYFEQRGAVA